ncbi:diaminopimelate decarboxylase [Haemophilus influenzae HK1212]|uniref:Diaminopimelate decarboxylase n=1 Tax=Haemophilus influenzae HK1212 TaxID=456482 RepID=A0A7G2K071_HAEIF|nr:diaminopimelate decarboxylase [Haemophilus influenzae HK1212]
MRALEVGIRCFNVESVSELKHINQIAGEMGKIAPISLRVNPDVDAHTHPYISTGLKENKFGVSVNEARKVYNLASTLPNIKITGMDCHIGSQLTELQPFLDATDRLIVLMEQLKEDGITLKHLDLGGGLGVTYTDEAPPHPSDYANALLEKLKNYPELEIQAVQAVCLHKTAWKSIYPNPACATSHQCVYRLARLWQKSWILPLHLRRNIDGTPRFF